MEIQRHEFEIIEVGEPRTIGNPSLREVPDFPSIANRLGTSTGVLLRHLTVSTVIASGAVALVGYAGVILLQGLLNAIVAFFTCEDYTISFTNLQIILENCTAFLKENF